jgi:hypothetical protein
MKTDELNGKLVGMIGFSNGETVSADKENELICDATDHGDRDEFWIVRRNRCGLMETARYNMRFVETIIWLNNKEI